jgi:TnpA family transposase
MGSSLWERGDIASNRLDDQELAVLALHLLQNCLVYINTLMLQQILAEPAWLARLTRRLPGTHALAL